MIMVFHLGEEMLVSILLSGREENTVDDVEFEVEMTRACTQMSSGWWCVWQ